MRVRWASEAAGPGRANEDFVAAGEGWVVVLDGATPWKGTDGGCLHGVPWLVRTLGAALGARLGEPRIPLAEALSGAIEATMAAHAATCDLANPDSPSATVAMLRERAGHVDHLVLCDSPAVLWRADGTIRVVHDDRLDRLPGGHPHTAEQVRRLRNADGGFWVASTSPEAARHALTGSTPAAGLRGAALLTDGVTRLVEWYGTGWSDLLTLLATGGPEAAIRAVREAELAVPGPYGKRHDDATAAWAHW